METAVAVMNLYLQQYTEVSTDNFSVYISTANTSFMFEVKKGSSNQDIVHVLFPIWFPRVLFVIYPGVIIIIFPGAEWKVIYIVIINIMHTVEARVHCATCAMNPLVYMLPSLLYNLW